MPHLPTSDEPAPSDAALVEATLAGEREAFGTLVERYQDRLHNTLLRVLGCREDADEVLQDAFVQAYVKLPSFRGASRFYTWLYRVALNLACSHRRRHRGRRQQVSLEQQKNSLGCEPMDPNPLPELALQQSEEVALVQAALLELSDEHRQVLVLRELEDCSYETIAEMLELPVGTVRSRLFRARLQLKEQVEGMLSVKPK